MLYSRRLFHDRTQAGTRLAAELRNRHEDAPIVLGLPRGGIPVAYEIARELGAPLDVCVVRKIGAPIQPELGVGAVAENGALFIDEETVELVDLSRGELERLIVEKRAEVDARVRTFRRGAQPLEIKGRTVILVDDGIATGGTVRAALQTLRTRGVARIVLAVPVAAPESLDSLAPLADDVVCLYAPEAFGAVGNFYEDFAQTTDEEVVALLERARHPEPSKSERIRARVDREVWVPLADSSLAGHLAIPSGARGLVIFAHGSGSSRHSPRNLHVAYALERYGLATLLVDLLTTDEAELEDLRFDIPLLSQRLAAVTEWAREQPETHDFAFGYFGASTGAAAALIAASNRDDIRAVVSRGGRTDLADDWLHAVRAPTLLIVGSADVAVLRLNQVSLSLLRGERQLAIVQGATHLFEEPGALDEVSLLAGQWFARHLGARAAAATEAGPRAGAARSR